MNMEQPSKIKLTGDVLLPIIPFNNMKSIYWLEYCRRRNSQEFGSDNDLPYCCHKRARLCLVCEALMQGEN